MSDEVLGFVGLGRMGGPMATRLVAAGHRLVAFDSAGTAERLPAGAIAAASAAEVARQADVVFFSLPDGAASRAVCAAVAATADRRTRTVVDLSTIGIAAARECAALLAAASVTYVDAPVSGGVAGARAGSLTIMVGAAAPVYEALGPLFAVLGKNVARVGEAPGQGQAMKLVNNFLSATAVAATSEAVILGARLGLDPAQMIAIINVSTGRSSASLEKFPRSILPRTYDYGFAGALMTKDVTLYLESAAAAGMPRDLAAAVARLWQAYDEACPGTDFTYIHKYLEDLAGA